MTYETSDEYQDKCTQILNYNIDYNRYINTKLLKNPLNVKKTVLNTYISYFENNTIYLHIIKNDNVEYDNQTLIHFLLYQLTKLYSLPEKFKECYEYFEFNAVKLGFYEKFGNIDQTYKYNCI